MSSYLDETGLARVWDKIKGLFTKSNIETALGHTVDANVPSGAVFTDTNNAVTQTATTTNSSNYEVLFSGTADNTTRTEGVGKSNKIKVNPYSGHLSLGGNIQASGAIQAGTYVDATDGYTAGSGSYLFSAYPSGITVDTSSDNHVDTNTYKQVLSTHDTGGMGSFSAIRTIYYTSGAVSTQLWAKNMKTDGSTVDNGFSVTVEKDGTQKYGVGNAANFRSAIGAGTSSLTLGTSSTTAAKGNHTHTGATYYSKSDNTSVSVSHNTWKNVYSVTLDAGIYIISFGGEFSANASNFRAICLSDSSTGSQRDRTALFRKSALNSGVTDISHRALLKLTSSKTLYFNVYQNAGSGTSLTFQYPFLQYIKLTETIS